MRKVSLTENSDTVIVHEIVSRAGWVTDRKEI